MKDTATYNELVREAATLTEILEDGEDENPEYLRGIVELLTYVFGGSVADGDGEQVRADIRAARS